MADVGAATAPPAFVYQCQQCLSIVGDSFSQVAANQELMIICVSSTSARVHHRRRAALQCHGMRRLIY